MSLTTTRAAGRASAAARGVLDGLSVLLAAVMTAASLAGLLIDALFRDSIDWTWTFVLDPVEKGRTRFTVRSRVRLDLTQPDRRRPPGREPLRPTTADLARQVCDVLADLPRFVAAPLLRPWHRRWGATRAEVTGPMPGGDRQPRAHLRATRAITVGAPPEEVWPWLVQVGCLRAGWYADDLLDNLAHPSARRILPELQDLEVGRWLPMAPTPTERTSFVVDSFEAPRWMLWRTPTSTWAWQLVPLPGDRTRLVTRLRVTHDWRHPTGILLLELGDWPMMRRMLRGIRDRAEEQHRLSARAAGAAA